MYYNTNFEIGEDLKRSRVRSERQEVKILRFFRMYPLRYFTPFEIQEYVLPGCPITSVRRAMTDLTDQGEIEKTDVMRSGRYGKQNHCWRLRPREPKQGELFK